MEKKRIAFTIVLNGVHHLKHKDYYKTILNNFDYWIVVEGVSGNSGSTSWCKIMLDKYHNNGSSVDGTVEFLDSLSKENSKLIFVKSEGFWKNKDEQVNRAIQEIKKITNNCFLWEIDSDEQWTLEQLEIAEKELIDNNLKTGQFHCNYYVGPNLMARGQWGEGKLLPYNRLWNWSGENFQSHEPPVLEGGNGNSAVLSPKFNHYAYYFEKDVAFKNDWYSGHENILERWKSLQEEIVFPQPISRLISGSWGNTNTIIIKI